MVQIKIAERYTRIKNWYKKFLHLCKSVISQDDKKKLTHNYKQLKKYNDQRTFC